MHTTRSSFMVSTSVLVCFMSLTLLFMLTNPTLTRACPVTTVTTVSNTNRAIHQQHQHLQTTHYQPNHIDTTLSSFPSSNLLITTPTRRRIKTSLCRISMEMMSICVESSIAFINNTDWCTYRFCGPSYIHANECTIDGYLDADHKCMIVPISKTIWKCKSNKEHIDIDLPENCVMGMNCTSREHVCPCKLEEVVQHKYTRIFKWQGNCKNGLKTTMGEQGE